jgi:hypothetical protein
MAAVHEIVGDVANLVARAAVARAESSSATSPDPTSQPTDNSQPQKDSGGGSSPLLFFVALGFGVVFTNLW